MNAGDWARQALREFTNGAATGGGVTFHADIPPGIHPNCAGHLPRVAVKAGAVRVIGVARSTKPTRRNGLQLLYGAGAPVDVARFQAHLDALEEQEARQMTLPFNKEPGRGNAPANNGDSRHGQRQETF